MWDRCGNLYSTDCVPPGHSMLSPSHPGHGEFTGSSAYFLFIFPGPKNQQSCSVCSPLSEFTVSVSIAQRGSIVRVSLMRTFLVVQVPLHRFSFFFLIHAQKWKKLCLKKLDNLSWHIVKPVNITRVLLATSLNKHPSPDHKYSPVHSTRRHRGTRSHRVPPCPPG